MTSLVGLGGGLIASGYEAIRGFPAGVFIYDIDQSCSERTKSPSK